MSQQEWLRRVSLAQLRVGFIVAGLISTTALFSMAVLVQQRLRDAEQERRELVASRVFDELEREISSFLEQEDDRSNYSELQSTNPESWAPFVVGYFAHDQQGSLQLAAADGPTTENRRRIRWAVEQVLQHSSSKLREAAPPIVGGARQEEADGAAAGGGQDVHSQSLNQQANQGPAQTQPESAAPPAKEQESAAKPSPVSGAKIIESLNRAPERRKQKSAPSQDDPFVDYMERY